MKALHSGAVPVPWLRVVREHRTALVPLGIVLAINLVVLVAVVLPLSRGVAANDERAQTADRAEGAARAEYQQAEAVREGKSRATADLQTFYGEVLPADVAAARRILSKIVKLADDHDVEYQHGSADTKEQRGSSLEQYTFALTLTGDYDDIRALIYDLETAPDFIVIDNIVLGEGQGQNAPLRLSMELSTYYRAPAARAGSGGASGPPGGDGGRVEANGR